MTPKGVAGVVARLFAASGRHYGEVELQVYSEALEEISDELGVNAALEVIRTNDLGVRAPSPNLVLQAAWRFRQQQAERTRAQTPALPESTDPYLDRDENLARIRAISAKVLKRVPS